MKHIYLSPHLDDAVLSCGGAIHRYAVAGEPVQIITIFSGDAPPEDALSPFARSMHRLWGNPPAPVSLRRAEDAVALAWLKATGDYLPWPDAIYRTAPDGTWLYEREEALWAAPHPADPLAQEGGRVLADQLTARIPRAENVQIYAPLAIGNHVDHQIVHMAALRLRERGYPLAFYEDFPYAEDRQAVRLRLAEGTWQALLIFLGTVDVIAKITAIGSYRSQMRVLFGGIEAMPNRVWAFALARGKGQGLAERVWR